MKVNNSEIIVEVIPYMSNTYQVMLSIDYQTFTLEPVNSKKHAEWHAEQLKKAFERLANYEKISGSKLDS